MAPQPHVMPPTNPVTSIAAADSSAVAVDADKESQKKAGADESAAHSDSDEPQAGEGTEQQHQQRPPQQQPDPSRHQMQQGGPPQQPQHQQQQIHMTYNMPPHAYYPAGGAMGMPPRPGVYPPQFVTGPPHQMPVQRTGAGPYGMYPAGIPVGGIPPNMQMRGPNGAPYYGGPGNPMMYMGQQGMVDDGGDPNYRGRGGSGGGRSQRQGRGQRHGRGHNHGRGGRGRGGYNNTNSHSNSNSPILSSGNQSGRNTPQSAQQNLQQQQQQQQSNQGSSNHTKTTMPSAEPNDVTGPAKNQEGDSK
jgi:hypothetical protein